MSVDKDLVSVQQARDLVEAAHRAQAAVAQFDQAKIDRICEAMAKAALREAARLGAVAVEETGYGVPDDKREKNRFAAEDVWNYFRGLRTKALARGPQARTDHCTVRAEYPCGGQCAAIRDATGCQQQRLR